MGGGGRSSQAAPCGGGARGRVLANSPRRCGPSMTSKRVGDATARETSAKHTGSYARPRRRSSRRCVRHRRAARDRPELAAPPRESHPTTSGGRARRLARRDGGQLCASSLQNIIGEPAASALEQESLASLAINGRRRRHGRHRRQAARLDVAAPPTAIVRAAARRGAATFRARCGFPAFGLRRRWAASTSRPPPGRSFHRAPARARRGTSCFSASSRGRAASEVLAVRSQQRGFACGMRRATASTSRRRRSRSSLEAGPLRPRRGARRSCCWPSSALGQLAAPYTPADRLADVAARAPEPSTDTLALTSFGRFVQLQAAAIALGAPSRSRRAAARSRCPRAAAPASSWRAPRWRHRALPRSWAKLRRRRRPPGIDRLHGRPTLLFSHPRSARLCSVHTRSATARPRRARARRPAARATRRAPPPTSWHVIVMPPAFAARPRHSTTRA